MPTIQPMSGVVVAHGKAKPGAGADRHRLVLRQFRALLRAVKYEFGGDGGGSGLGVVRVWALRVIAEHPGIGIAQFAASLDICQPTASAMAKSLRQRGLIECRKGTVDRRTVQLFLLPEGRLAVAQAREVFSGPLACALSRLGRADLANLEVDLGSLIVHLRPRRKGAGPAEPTND